MAVGTEKWALVTGATDGIGRETALGLARLGYSVLVHARSPERGTPVIEAMRHRVTGANFQMVIGDLSSLGEVRHLAEQVKTITPSLHALVNNAGVKPLVRKTTADGFEMTFGVNHLSHFLLTNLLLEELQASQAGRVVTVSSVSHYRGTIEWDDLQLVEGWDSYRAYAQSKLANVLFAFELARRLQGTVTSNALHPGVVATKLLKIGFGADGIEASQGAETSVFLAGAPEARGISGTYFSDGQQQDAATLAHRKDWQAVLWDVSATMVGLK